MTPRTMRTISLILAAVALIPALVLAGDGYGDSPRFSLNTISIVGAASTPPANRLAPCYPNPFNPSTTIEYRLAEPAVVTLAIYDLLGRRVRVLRDGEATDVGLHTQAWDGLNRQGQPVAGGVYLCRLEAGGFTACRRMTLVK